MLLYYKFLFMLLQRELKYSHEVRILDRILKRSGSEKQSHCFFTNEILDAIHWTKISGNSGTKSNGTERFWKLISKILDNLQRLSFFPEIWKFREIPVPSVIRQSHISVIGHYYSVSSSSRPKRWRRQVFSPAIRMRMFFVLRDIE